MHSSVVVKKLELEERTQSRYFLTAIFFENDWRGEFQVTCSGSQGGTTDLTQLKEESSFMTVWIQRPKSKLYQGKEI